MRVKLLFKAISILALVPVIVLSCKTPETVTETRLKPMSPARLLRNVEESAFDYTTFSVRRINIQIDDGTSKTNFRAGMQAVRDQQIQLTITKFNIPLGRIQLTPDSIIFVNYMEKTFVADNYNALSSLFDFDLDFNAIQAIVSGNVFSFFDEGDDLRNYQASTGQGQYVIRSEKYRKLRKIEEKGKTQKMERMLKRTDNDALIVHTFGFDPELFVMRQMILEDKTNHRKASLNFDDYSKVGQKYYPGTVLISIDSEEGKFNLDTRMSGFSTEPGELSSLKIPEKYQRLYLN